MITDQLDSAVLNQRVLDVIQTLNDKLVARRDKAGWHNAFKGDRIGTSGTALPLRFLLAAGEQIPHRENVLNALRDPSLERDDQAAWSILSLGPDPNVEGTVWPMLALIDNGDPVDIDLITRAETWLLAQQHDNGGWGSNRDNEARLTLTASAINALRKSMPRQAPQLLQSETWLRDAQRVENGAWGATPAESGTVHHTALACLALIQLGVSLDDSSLQRGREYLRANWESHPRAIHTENYDVHQPDGGYKRCILEHDPYALAVEALLSLRGPRDLTVAVRAASQIFEVEIEGLEVEQPTLWTILPRGFLALRLLGHLPAGGRLIARQGVTAIVDRDNGRASTDLALLTFSELPFKPRNPVRILYWLIAIVLLSLTALTVLGDFGVGEFIASVVLAGLFTLATVVRDRRK